jgi:hypothetical protein
VLEHRDDRGGAPREAASGRLGIDAMAVELRRRIEIEIISRPRDLMISRSI